MEISRENQGAGRKINGQHSICQREGTAQGNSSRQPGQEPAERKKERIRVLLAELKELQASPRSDWHAGFEALLRIEMHRYGQRVKIEREHLLGGGSAAEGGLPDTEGRRRPADG